MFLFVLSRRQARPNTFLTERMSVSVSRLEAGRPSCDSMWLARASRSLDTHSHSLSEWEGGGVAGHGAASSRGESDTLHL